MSSRDSRGDRMPQQTIRRNAASVDVWRRRLQWAAAFVVGSVLVGACWIRFAAESLPDLNPPSLRLEMASPDVARRIQQARDEVIAKPKSGKAWGQLGMIVYAHQFEAATNECLERATRLDPTEFRWPYLLATNLAVSDPEAAAMQFRKAIRLRPDYATAHLRLGDLLSQLERTDEARLELEAARRLDGDNPRVLVSLARLHLMHGDHATSLALANQAARLAPEVASVHELLSEVHQRLGDREAAVVELKIAQQVSQDSLPWNDPIASDVMELRQDANWLVERANVLLAQNQIAEAIQQLRLALSRDQRDPRVFCQLSDLLTKTGKLQDAKTILDVAEKKHPASAMVHFQRGIWQFQRQDFEAASIAFQRAIELKPDYAIAHYNLAQTWIKLNKPDQALNSVQRAIQFRPDFFDAYLAAAKLSSAESQHDARANYLRQALRLRPGHGEAQQLLDEASK